MRFQTAPQPVRSFFVILLIIGCLTGTWIPVFAQQVVPESPAEKPEKETTESAADVSQRLEKKAQAVLDGVRKELDNRALRSEVIE